MAPGLSTRHNKNKKFDFGLLLRTGDDSGLPTDHVLLDHDQDFRDSLILCILHDVMGHGMRLIRQPDFEH